MANYSCDLDTLITNAACLTTGCVGETGREAIDLYLRIQNLRASGGVDYSGADGLSALLVAAKEWQILRHDQRKAIELWMDLQNAIFNDAVVSQNANVLTNQTACYKCIGKEEMANLLSFLKCQLNSIDQPD